ncbi:MAG TPA: cellulase family glycosylhydrolase [Arsenicitalea sp.]|nr:cellulase family glycosylhydrolase [Arsenicitalea sp.]
MSGPPRLPSTVISRRVAIALPLLALIAGRFGGAAAAAPSLGGGDVPSRGFNLPGWVDREDGTAMSQGVLEKLHRLGFETIRLPVDPGLIGADDASARRDLLRRVDTAISACLTAGFRVIVDMHPSGPLVAAFGDDLQGALRIAVAGWKNLGSVVAQWPTQSVFPELLNEPPMERPHWVELRDRLAAIVRDKCPQHTLVWGPSRYQGIWEVFDTPALPDRNAIVAVHYYTPMGFTHQCENWDWSPLARIANLPFPATRNAPAIEALADKFRNAGDQEALDFLDGEFKGAWTAARIAADFAGLAQWAAKTGSRVMLNEFGVLNFCVDPTSRASWVRSVRTAAEANGIGWTYWEADQGFGFIKDRRRTDGFDAATIDALVKT